jgi:hypothetical protein
MAAPVGVAASCAVFESGVVCADAANGEATASANNAVPEIRESLAVVMSVPPCVHTSENQTFMQLKGKLTRDSDGASDYEAGFIADCFRCSGATPPRLTDRPRQASLRAK